MPRTGRPPKPVELKRKLGNPGKRRLPNPITAIAPVTVLEIAKPDAPSRGDELTEAILAAGGAAWIGQTDRLGLLAMLRDGWDERSRLRSALYDPPEFIEELDPKSRLSWIVTTRRDLRDMEKQITAWLSLLGLTPSDRSRLGVAEVKAQTKLEDLHARRDARLARSRGG
jgi:hypothetical protein